MSSHSLTFRSLELRRMPGFSGRDGFRLDDFAPGINILFGPNGSGKSTCLKALQGCIWPETAASVASLRTSFGIGEHAFQLDLESGRTEYQKGGKPSSAPDLPSAEISSRYRLSLDELLQDDGRDFSAVIARESAGGYSLEEARSTLRWDSRAAKPGSLLSRLAEAQARVREAEARQRQLRQEVIRLEDLESEILESREAAAEASRYQLLINYKTGLETRNEARRRFESFDNRMNLLAGNELDILAGLRAHVSNLDRQRKETLAAIRKAEETIAGLRLPEGALSDRLISEQKSRCSVLQSLQAEIAVTRRDLAQAAALRESARRTLGDPAPSDADLRAIHTERFGRLADFARKVEKLRGEREALRAIREWLGGSDIHSVRANVGEMLSLLRRWLASGDGPEWRQVFLRLPLCILAGSLLGSGTALALWLSVWWLAPAVAGAALAAWLLLSQPPAERRELLRQEFITISARQPEVWSREGVEQLVATLMREEAGMVLEEQKAQRWSGLSGKRLELEQKTRELEQLGQQIRGELGVIVPADADDAQIFVLAERLLAWQVADSNLAAMQARLDELEKQRAELLSQVNKCLAEFSRQPVQDAAAAGAAIDELNARLQDYLLATERLKDGRDSLAAMDEQAAGLEQQIKQLFARFSLSPDEEPELQQWLRKLSDLREAERALDRADHDLRKAEEETAGSLHLARMSLPDLQARRQDCQNRADRLEGLLTLRTQIQERVQAAKASTEIQNALSDLERSREELRINREQEAARAVGALLVEFVDGQSRASSQPAVLRRAARLFARFTHHHWDLDFEPGVASGLRAIECATGRGHALDELSKGTRLQLLLAVRLAFVEEQERDCRLPLFLDETLGNSDESRAELIITTLLQLAADGRQVFYVTAQADEVSKWKVLLDDHPEVQSAFFDLAEIRNLQRFERAPLSYSVADGFRPAQLPSPSGVSREEYGRLLRVPAFDPLSPVESLHLWYVIEEPDTLHQLMSRFLRTWGHLKAQVETAGLGPLSELQFRKAEASARAIETAFRLWRNGRGKPVDSETIVASGVVSDIFRQQVCELAGDCGGNAAVLIGKLEAGAVARFQTKTVARLRGFLEENGFLDNRPVLSQEEILRQMCAGAGADISQGLIEPETLVWILNLLPRGNIAEASVLNLVLG